ncbi:MAG: BTAD domain-containing putative transcriptional regulator [Rhodothermales bacterium]
MDDILQVTLLGRFEATWNGQPVAGFEHAKARELFSYLLLHREKPNSRELIASSLWGGHYTTEVSKKYLRKALWQLNECLAGCSEEIRNDLIVADANWLELKMIDPLWLDVAFVDNAYAAVKGLPGFRINKETADVISNVVDLYRGDLLEGEYQEWSFYDNVRYRQAVLILLDKLMDYSLAHGEYESTLQYGERVLRCDPAREFTHLKLMRAYYELGDRTGAIHQFNRCRQVLHDELDVNPSHEAVKLFELIRNDEASEMSLIPGGGARDGEGRGGSGSGLELVVGGSNLTSEQEQQLQRLIAGA